MTSHFLLPREVSRLRDTQFTTSCERFLLIKDDLKGAGMGWTAKLLTYALLLAHSQHRVMLEVPTNGRWCEHSPYTFQCYFKEWSNCTLPRSRPPITSARAVHSAYHEDVVTLSLEEFHHSGIWYGLGMVIGRVVPYSTPLLFSPVTRIQLYAESVLRECDMKNLFWTVFLRDSPEKRLEARTLPSFETYARHIERMGIKTIFWQTSSDHLFRRAVEYSKRNRLKFCYTKNKRYIHDVWGGRNASLRGISGWVGALNYALGRRSAGVISPQASMWTWFLHAGLNVSLLAL